MDIKFSNKSAYCQKFGDNIEIEIKSVSVPILGTTTPQYKKISFECPNNSCELNGSFDCLLFMDV